MFGSEDFFAFGSKEDGPERYFAGYAFIGSDLVIGTEGLARYRAQTKARMTPGHDGTYVHADTCDGITTIGTDGAGHVRLFYYRNGDDWDVSTSLIGLARRVRDRGWPLTLNLPQILSWRCDTVLFQCMTSFETVFNEIALCPMDRQIQCGPNGMSLIPVPPDPHGPEDYAACLTRYLATWLARVGAILDDAGLTVEFDLTGGLDSRINLAFFTHLNRQRDGIYAHAGKTRFVTSGHAEHSKDYAVASDVLAELGLARGPDLRSRPFAMRDPVEWWRLNCLGQYYPFRDLFTGFPSPDLMRFHGNGGEDYRRFYRSIRRQKGAARRVARWSAARRIKRAVAAAIKRQAVGPQSKVPEGVVHYRAFRSRFHGGIRAVRTLLAMPLKSRMLLSCADQLPPQVYRSRQLLCDVLVNLDPELARLPFDSPKKAFSQENFDRVTYVTPLPHEPGRVFRGPTPPPATGKTPSKAMAFDAMDRAVAAVEPEITGAHFTEREAAGARAALQRATETERLRDHAEARMIHFALLLAELRHLGFDLDGSGLAAAARPPGLLHRVFGRGVQIG